MTNTHEATVTVPSDITPAELQGLVDLAVSLRDLPYPDRHDSWKIEELLTNYAKNVL
ncbi:hypothetical protein ACTOB_003055 [Actinoplanes oblitus]|uniref:Uncharacterized protein n=1 Tax=Actinoplanes oblitus TaxID=3040509 RepID=A0ABY8WSY9_9ACTN|nr:hypothetical protein [Actinoplanes oblitus]WIM99404.1 hypothetical protein ACTOB_003055 [Actinoplanes oblitus]